MPRLLITGANSYIGTSLGKYLRQGAKEYLVETIDMIDGSWRQKDFCGFDTVFHVAGIAHQKETSENAKFYYEINRDLTFETARKAKASGVHQFIFLSSMSIYGMDTGIITPRTIPKPVSHYGKSKLQAEEMLSSLSSEAFRIAILRPPMVYGKGCKGNFQSLVKIAHKCSFFPWIDNYRSMIFIENLCEFVKLLIETQATGVFFPQNQEYIQTSQMMCWLGEAMGHKVFSSRFLGRLIRCFFPFSQTIRKAFGTLIYQDCEKFGFVYCKGTLEETVKRSI